MVPGGPERAKSCPEQETLGPSCPRSLGTPAGRQEHRKFQQDLPVISVDMSTPQGTVTAGITLGMVRRVLRAVYH